MPESGMLNNFQKYLPAILVVVCLFIPHRSCSQDFLPRLDQFKSIQKDSVSFYYKEIWLKSKDINNNDPAGFISRANSKIESGYFKEAMLDVEKAISIDSTIGQSYFLKGYLMLHSDSLERALSFFDKSIALHDTNVYSYYYKAMIFSRMNKYEDAYLNFNKAIGIDKKFAEAYFGLANLQISQFKANEAERLYKKVININPDFAYAYFNLGLMCILSDGNKAMKYFDKTIELSPAFANAYFIRGYLEKNQGKISATYKDWNKAVELDSANKMYLTTLGLLNIVDKNYATGFDQITKALADFPLKSYFSYFEVSARNKLTNDFISQVITYKTYSDKFTGDEKSKIKEALSLFFTGKFKDAEAIYADMSTSASVPGLIMYLRAFNQEYLQQAELSLENYKKAIVQKIFPEESYLRSGIVLNFLGRYREAIENFKVFSHNNDSVRLCHRSLAASYINISEYDSAICVLNKLIKLDSTELDIYFDRAFCLKKQEKYLEAMKDCSFIINHNPRNSETICLKAECQYLLGDTSGAYTSLNYVNDSIWGVTEEGYFILGSINLHYKKYDIAIDDFDAAISMNQKRTEAYIYRGLCYFCKAEYKNAKNDLTIAINLDGNEVVGLYTRGLVNIKLNKLNEAWSDLTKAQSLGHPLARRAILLYLKNYKPPKTES